MIGKILDFLFSPPPPAPSNNRETVEPVVAFTKEDTPVVYEPAPARSVLPIFFPLLLPCMLLTATASYFLGPQLPRLDMSVITMLTISSWILAACGSLLGIALAYIAADVYVIAQRRRASKLFHYGEFWRSPLIWAALLAITAFPLYHALQASILFREDTVQIGSLYSLRPRVYNYEHISRVLAHDDAEGDTFLSPGTFYFSIEFDDGAKWDSQHHPEGPWAGSMGRVIRFLARKTGKFVDVAAPNNPG